MANEVRNLQLQKEIEGLRRKVVDAIEDKRRAVSRLNAEWDQKLLAEKTHNIKKWEVERQEMYLTLETNIKLAKDKDIAQILSDKDRELRRMRENMNYERDNAIRIAKANSEEKYRTLFKQIQEESKHRENSLTKEINLLSKEKENLQERVSAIRNSDLEKANTIKFLHYNQEKIIKELNEAAKHDSAEEYKRYRALQSYAQDKESAVNVLNSKVLRLDNEREMLEKQLLTVSKFSEAHGSGYNPILAPKVVSTREIELARKVRELEKELQQQQTPQQSDKQLSLERVNSVEQTIRQSSLDVNSPFSPSRPVSDGNTTSSPTPSPSADLERIKRLQEQRRQLKEMVTTREQQIHQLDQCTKDLTMELEKAIRSRDEIENQFVVDRETFIMDHNKEMDELVMNNTELQDKLQECSNDVMILRKQLTELEQSRALPTESSNIEEEAVLLQNQLSVLENKYRRIHKESLSTESLFSQWCAPDQHVTVDSNDKVMQLELELSYTRDDLREALEQVDAFQIRNEKLKLDYQKSRNDVDRLICQRERATDEKKKAEDTEKEMREAFKELSEQISRYSNLDKELKNQKEKYITTKESLTSKIEHQNAEIERLRTFEMKALQVDPLKRELEHYKMNGNGNSAASPPAPSNQEDKELINALSREIAGLKDELSILEQVNKKKDRLIKRLDARDSINSPKLSNPSSLEYSSVLPRPNAKYSQTKISPTRHMSSSSSSNSSQLMSYDDSYSVNNNNNSKIQTPNIHGSLTLPRPVKHRSKLPLCDRMDEL
ncbi:hypothetical protein LOD99_17 [Oopsacas minuta]|uniref:Uncharacterized protein n=1 Tax=Oopsacas minuta TaxID=111878 RepID=A0AAV7K8V7_9METZ|nr:hypothetical protein LOD99_17 [Oopsacas minuta]